MVPSMDVLIIQSVSLHYKLKKRPGMYRLLDSVGGGVIFWQHLWCNRLLIALWAVEPSRLNLGKDCKNLERNPNPKPRLVFQPIEGGKRR